MEKRICILYCHLDAVAGGLPAGRQGSITSQSKKHFLEQRLVLLLRDCCVARLYALIAMQLYREGCKTPQLFTAFARLALACRSNLFFAVVHTFIIQSCLMLNQVMRRHGASSIHRLATKLARVQ